MATHDAAPSLATPTMDLPTGKVARVLAYFGGLCVLGISLPRAIVRPRGPAPTLLPAVFRQLDDLFANGLPLVALVHIPMGSFLAMQAFFHATFTEAVGAVVGLGLVRNLAPLLAGMVLTALLALKIVPELRGSHAGLDGDDLSVPDREVARGGRPDPRPVPEPARLAAVRVLSAAIAGPVLATWGAIIGLLIGLVIAQAKLSVAPGIFLGKLAEMVHPNDAVGLMAKSALFGVVSALVACHEGLRGDSDPRAVAPAVFRSVCIALTAMLVVNACWFTVEYLSGPAFGPPLAPG